MMRTSSQVAQYVALRALGYEDARIRPGEVVVSDFVCLEQSEVECTRFAPAERVLEVGDTLLDGGRRPAGDGRRPRRPARGP